jgi:hypothetical protein
VSGSSRSPELVLILGAARSGTTLLRSLLDAHPDIGCPAEAALPQLISHTRRVWATVCSSEGVDIVGDPLPAVAPGGAGRAGEHVGQPERARTTVRAFSLDALRSN